MYNRRHAHPPPRIENRDSWVYVNQQPRRQTRRTSAPGPGSSCGCGADCRRPAIARETGHESNVGSEAALSRGDEHFSAEALASGAHASIRSETKIRSPDDNAGSAVDGSGASMNQAWAVEPWWLLETALAAFDRIAAWP